MFPTEIVVFFDRCFFRLIRPLTLALSPEDGGEGTRNGKRVLSYSLIHGRAVREPMLN